MRAQPKKPKGRLKKLQPQYTGGLRLLLPQKMPLVSSQGSLKQEQEKLRLLQKNAIV